MHKTGLFSSLVIVWLTWLCACSDDPIREVSIQSFAPEAEGPGNEVRIAGMGFLSDPPDLELDFNGTAAEVSYLDDTLIVTTVPDGAVSGPINLRVAGRPYSSLTEFVVLQGQWTQKADIPFDIGFGAATAFVIDGKAYLGTGGDNGRILDEFWQYDPATDQWSGIPSIPGGARRFCTSFVINDQAYVGLGVIDNTSDLTPSFYRYNPGPQTWTALNDFPGELPSFKDTYSSFVLSDRGYLLLRKQLWEYNPDTDLWTEKSAYPGVGNSNHVAISLNAVAYVGLGFTEAYDWWEYSPQNDTWTSLRTYPGEFTWAVQSFRLGQSVFVVGKQVWEYDPPLGMWVQRTGHPDGRRFGSTFSIGDKGYLATGISNSPSGSPFQKDLWEFVPE